MPPIEQLEPTWQLAKRELRETGDAKRHALEHMKQWLAKNQQVADVRTDDVFLLRFLRVKKYSLPMAEQTLLKWLNLRATFPAMLKGLDCQGAAVAKLLDDGYIYVSPRRDQHGRRVIVYDIKKFDPVKYTSEDMAKIHCLTYETLLEDEETQIRGVVHVADLAGFGGGHVACWSPEVFIRLIRWGEQSLPLRHKEIHLLNFPIAVKYLYELIKALLSQKMNKRIVLHGNLTSLSDKIAPACLPKAYGGVVPAEDMIKAWSKEVQHHNPTIMSLDRMQILSAAGISTSKQRKSDTNNNHNVENNLKGLSGSFRKLEID